MLATRAILKSVSRGNFTRLCWTLNKVSLNSFGNFRFNHSANVLSVQNSSPGTSVIQKRYYSDEKIEINFVNRKGEKTVVTASRDDTLLDVVIDNDMDIESFGVCEGTLGCSTCHVILEKPIFELMDKLCPPTAEELDMLDMACGLTETSRLGCQVEVSAGLNGCTITIPKEALDARDL